MSCTAMTFSMVACGGASTDTTTPADTSADTETEAPTEEAEAPAEEEAEAPAEDGALTYSSITLGEDYTDLTATIKWLHHKTDRAEDGTIDKMKQLPITQKMLFFVFPQVTGVISCLSLQ